MLYSSQTIIKMESVVSDTKPISCPSWRFFSALLEVELEKFYILIAKIQAFSLKFWREKK